MILPRTAICDKGLRAIPDRLPERRPPGRRALRPLRPRHDDGGPASDDTPKPFRSSAGRRIARHLQHRTSRHVGGLFRPGAALQLQAGGGALCRACPRQLRAARPARGPVGAVYPRSRQTIRRAGDLDPLGHARRVWRQRVPERPVDHLQRRRDGTDAGDAGDLRRVARAATAWATIRSIRTTTSSPAPPICARCTTSTARPASSPRTTRGRGDSTTI